ncbi:hypothetical protein [Shimia sp. R11_0]|uniref:hypothetical protein n=1 Tax=Shimia sp. R11_0 TaxID=2821096 RepID=UPI001FFE0E9C|nr:hypothetical protein [Shimia sp. R11_0]
MSMPYKSIDVLRTVGCDTFEMGLLPVLRHLVLGMLEGEAKACARAFDIAIERYGEAIGLPVAHGLQKMAVSWLTCRQSESGPEMRDPLCLEAKKTVTEDEIQIISMVHHMRRDNASAARSAVACVTHGRMDPEFIRAGLSFAHRFPAGVRRNARPAGRPKLSVVA